MQFFLEMQYTAVRIGSRLFLMHTLFSLFYMDSIKSTSQFLFIISINLYKWGHFEDVEKSIFGLLGKEHNRNCDKRKTAEKGFFFTLLLHFFAFFVQKVQKKEKMCYFVYVIIPNARTRKIHKPSASQTFSTLARDLCVIWAQANRGGDSIDLHLFV